MKVVKVVVGRSQPKAISTREATDGLPNVEDETDSLQPAVSSYVSEQAGVNRKRTA